VPNVKAQHEHNIAKTLTAMGQKADELTKKNIKASGRVDTGTMLNSVQSEIDVANREIIHGNTVHYAVYQETGTWLNGPFKRGPFKGITPGNFICDTVNNGQDEFKAITESVLGEGFS
jgi:hypothetical protein